MAIVDKGMESCLKPRFFNHELHELHEFLLRVVIDYYEFFE